MLLGSINYSNSLGYFLTFLLASLSVVTIFHTYNNLLKLSFGSAICIPVFACDEGFFLLQVNNKNYHTRYTITAFTENNVFTHTDIEAHSLSTIKICHTFVTRGLSSLPRITIESRFPFGLFRTWAIIQLDQEQLVYPKPSTDRFLPSKSAGTSEGNKQLSIGTDDFKSLRPYAEGDPLQHVHWKSFARHQTLQTKEFSSSTSNELWLNYSDTNVSGFEAKLSQLTQWLLLANKNNLNYGLRLFNLIVSPNNGKTHLDSCLKQLALCQLNENIK